MKLFIVTYPNSECDWFANEVCLAMSRAYDYEVRKEPEDRDANYYCINFGKSKGMAEATERRVKAGPNGMGILMTETRKFVYGLYRTEIISEDMSLDEYITMK